VKLCWPDVLVVRSRYRNTYVQIGFYVMGLKELRPLILLAVAELFVPVEDDLNGPLRIKEPNLPKSRRANSKSTDVDSNRIGSDAIEAECDFDLASSCQRGW